MTAASTNDKTKSRTRKPRSAVTDDAKRKTRFPESTNEEFGRDWDNADVTPRLPRKSRKKDTPPPALLDRRDFRREPPRDLDTLRYKGVPAWMLRTLPIAQAILLADVVYWTARKKTKSNPDGMHAEIYGTASIDADLYDRYMETAASASQTRSRDQHGLAPADGKYLGWLLATDEGNGRRVSRSLQDRGLISAKCYTTDPHRTNHAQLELEALLQLLVESCNVDEEALAEIEQCIVGANLRKKTKTTIDDDDDDCDYGPLTWRQIADSFLDDGARWEMTHAYNEITEITDKLQTPGEVTDQRRRRAMERRRHKLMSKAEWCRQHLDGATDLAHCPILVQAFRPARHNPVTNYRLAFGQLLPPTPRTANHLIDGMVLSFLVTALDARSGYAPEEVDRLHWWRGIRAMGRRMGLDHHVVGNSLDRLGWLGLVSKHPNDNHLVNVVVERVEKFIETSDAST